MSKKELSFAELSRSFEQRDFSPLYFFYGDETLQMDELQKQLVETALQPHERDFNLDVFFGPEADVRNVLATCAGYPMMAERRVVVVRSFENLADNREFTAYASAPNPTAVVLLLCQGKPNLTTHPYRALKQHAVALEFKQLRDRDLGTWLVRRAKKDGFTLEPSAAQVLVQEVGTDLRQAVAELDKLKAYVGERRTIAEGDVHAAGGHTRDENVFELQRSIVAGDVMKSTQIVEGLLSRATSRQGEALRLVSLLAWFFQRVRQTAAKQARGLPDQEIARQIGARSFQMNDYRSAVKRLGPRAVRAAPQALLAADFELKGGSSRDPRLVLLLAVRAIQSARRRAGTVVGNSR